ncbi:phenylalanine ammonia-lyase [Delitschia confertaspora ATCC 74209]|uniref:Phenylalanine ammonia-lyase n=1 Tax=Delitschia confertaspora ATCC 74209 TaxID=1513339 RepID=A0A9P4MLT1_9PLEO|nr:phenylalanine ammonia-lyase [Delitschia confertaspora ATCC 74209]
MAPLPRPHSSVVQAEWGKLSNHIKNREPITIDGSSLDMASITAVARHGIPGSLSSDPIVLNRIKESVRFLDEHMAQGNTVYGINTGFGGSADVRCGLDEMNTLQRSLLQHLQCGVASIPQPSTPRFGSAPRGDRSLSLPEDWVRAAMIIRCNSLARGHSAVRVEVIKSLLTLLKHNVIPVVPLRGTISASGDLCPLSYLAGALEGNADIYVWFGEQNNEKRPRRMISAAEALPLINLPPTIFGPKEGLGLVNGTAVSCAVASLTLHSLHHLMSLSQVLTAMGVEAILGAATSFAPFISAARPHPGQAEVASNVLAFLSGSHFASDVFGTHTTVAHGLYQDRYSVRTAPQWLGPFIEDLLLAHQQLTTELNSTTDNPLVDAPNGQVYHGGNFQAVSVTTAMEKSRLAAQAIGRMLFSQCTELLNPAMNRGLPPSLCADEPSLSFTMKGLDTSMAAYMSELSYLANPVHNHVVIAEMGNQALNSLALVSARYTDTAVELVTLMCAGYLYALCQALDLRAMIESFQRTFKTGLLVLIQQTWASLSPTAQTKLHEALWAHVEQEIPRTTTLDSRERFRRIMEGSQGVLIGVFEGWEKRNFTTRAADSAVTAYNETREEYFTHAARGEKNPSHLVGSAGKRVYKFVRKDLEVPMNKGVVDHPTPMGEVESGNNMDKTEKEKEKKNKKTIGHWIGVIFEAIRDERMMGVVVECLKEVE